MLKSVEEEQGLKKTNEKHNYNLDLMKIFACIAVVVNNLGLIEPSVRHG